MNQPQQIQIKADDATIKGHFANAAQISSTKEEFVLDFMSNFPPAGQLVSRVFVTPAHAKRLAAALANAVKQFEAQNGAIAVGETQPEVIGFRA